VSYLLNTFIVVVAMKRLSAMFKLHLTNLSNIITAKKRPPLDAQKPRAVYKTRSHAKAYSQLVVGKWCAKRLAFLVCNSR
jgi:hypothetical protein